VVSSHFLSQYACRVPDLTVSAKTRPGTTWLDEFHRNRFYLSSFHRKRLPLPVRHAIADARLSITDISLSPMAGTATPCLRFSD
jgi:hypothetical protein